VVRVVAVHLVHIVGVRVVRVGTIRIVTIRLDASGIVVTVVVGNDGGIGRNRIAISPRTHVRVRFHHSVSGRVAVSSV
jgi:hypothetical protein